MRIDWHNRIKSHIGIEYLNHNITLWISDCVLDGQTFSDGSSWRDGCNTCHCDAGRATCVQVTCDCRVSGEDRGCCPQCSDPLTCAHQVIPGLRYSAGQRWVHNCQECECLVSKYQLGGAVGESFAFPPNLIRSRVCSSQCLIDSRGVNICI